MRWGIAAIVAAQVAGPARAQTQVEQGTPVQQGTPTDAVWPPPGGARGEPTAAARAEPTPEASAPGVATSPTGAARPQGAAPSEIVRENRPAGRVGLGAGMGMGVGLVGVFADVRITDGFGLEAGVGKRLFLVTITGPWGTSTETYWPTAGTVKAQWLLGRPQARYRSGVEAGALFAEDLGVGGEVAYLGRLRLARNVYIHLDVGLAVWPDAEKNAAQYVADQRGGSAASYVDDVVSTPVALMWGAGIAVAF